MISTPTIASLVYREGLSSVFQSQVLVPARKLRELGVNMLVEVAAPPGEFFRAELKGRWQNLLADTGADVPIRRIPVLPSRMRNEAVEAAIVSFLSHVRKASTRPQIVHARNAPAACLALRVRQQGQQIIYDCRGLEAVEAAYRDPSCSESGKARVLQDMQDRAVRGADAILCVSRAMQEHLAAQYDLSPERITVVPCCVEEDVFRNALRKRSALRTEMALSDKQVLVYSGGMQRWQRTDALLRLFRLVLDMEPAAHLLALVTDPGKMKTMLKAAGLESHATVLNVPAAQVPNMLSAGDMGVLIRDRCLVNQVASPVKFGEYLAAGLSVLMTEGIGDFSELARDEKLGVVFSDPDSIGKETAKLNEFLVHLRSNAEAQRAHCMRTAAEHLSWNVHAPRLKSLYDSMFRQEGS